MADKLSMEELLSQAAGNKPEAPPVEEEDPVDPIEEPLEEDNPDGDGGDGTEDGGDGTEDGGGGTEDGGGGTEDGGEEKKGAPAKKTSPPKKKSPEENPIKAVRDQLTKEKQQRTKMETTFNRYTSGDYPDIDLKDFVVEGKLDYEELEAALDKFDTQRKAESKGVSPEVQEELERMEKERIELAKQQLQVRMDRSLVSLQQQHGLKEAEINQFFKDALEQKKNPYQWLAQGGNILDLYNTLYMDKIIERRIEERVAKEKEKWEKSIERQTRRPTPNPATPKATPSRVNPEGLTMDEMLAEAAQKVAKTRR